MTRRFDVPAIKLLYVSAIDENSRDFYGILIVERIFFEKDFGCGVYIYRYGWLNGVRETALFPA